MDRKFVNTEVLNKSACYPELISGADRLSTTDNNLCKKFQISMSVGKIPNQVHNDKRSFAFTLAEVLITLVIIGVIAAITVPTLYADYKEQEVRSRVKKMYSTLSNALTRAKADGGDIYFDNPQDDQATINKWYDDYLSPYLNVIKLCKGSETQVTDCWKRPTGLNGSTSYGGGNALVAGVLADGSTFMADRWTPSTFGINPKYDTSDTGMIFYMDINGERKPNIIGKDVFIAVFISQEGFVPAYRDRTLAQVNSDCSRTGIGLSCIRKYLYQ